MAVERCHFSASLSSSPTVVTLITDPTQLLLTDFSTTAGLYQTYSGWQICNSRIYIQGNRRTGNGLRYYITEPIHINVQDSPCPGYYISSPLGLNIVQSLHEPLRGPMDTRRAPRLWLCLLPRWLRIRGFRKNTRYVIFEAGASGIHACIIHRRSSLSHGGSRSDMVDVSAYFSPISKLDLKTQRASQPCDGSWEPEGTTAKIPDGNSVPNLLRPSLGS